MPAAILAAAAIGQLHHGVVGHLSWPIQRQKQGKAQQHQTHGQPAYIFVSSLLQRSACILVTIQRFSALAALLHFFLTTSSITASANKNQLEVGENAVREALRQR